MKPRIVCRVVVTTLCCWMVLCACVPALETTLTDETGFEGAVSVLSVERQDAFDVALARVPYRDIYGAAQTGIARVVVHRQQLQEQAPLPIFCHVHYEMGIDGARRWAEQGWAVFTAVYNEEAPIAVSVGDGNNLARAIIQWARRCAFTDSTRLHLDGGSQGGYMVLAMSADMFPVTSATSDAPVVNWAYNFNYFEANRPLLEDYEQPFDAPLPVMAAVLPLADMSYVHFTDDVSDDAWYYVSPVSKVSYITNPTMILFGTGDMLVPMEQMSRKHVPDCAFDTFPAGYQRDFDAVTLNDRARVPFEELLPEEQVFTHVEPLQENSYVITLDMRLGKEEHPEKRPEPIERKWSQEHQWNLYYLDEGCALPFSDHFTYAWNTRPDSYVAHYRDATPAPDILTAPKLERLLERYDDALTVLPALNNGAEVNRRNFDDVERRDVIAGLLEYASLSEAHAARLRELYQAGTRKPFGAPLSGEMLQERLDTLTRPEATP